PKGSLAGREVYLLGQINSFARWRDRSGGRTLETMPSPGEQIFWLVILAIPIACISRTVVYEEVFREPREWCEHMSKACRGALARKFFYLFTCEYCFSHWVTFFFLWLTRFKLLLPD